MNKRFLTSIYFSLFAISGAADPASAAPANSETAATVLRTELPKKDFEENREITDAKLRADAGSLSRYSLKFNLTYMGPPVSDLSAKEQPNPDGSVGSYQTSLGGSFGLRYRLNPKSALGVSTGLRAIHPMHGTERVDLSNPSLTVDYATRVAGMQMKNTPGLVVRTVPEFKKVGQYGMIYDSHSLVYDLGTSGLAIGADSALGIYLYDRDYQIADKKAASYSFDLSPNVRYNFSDKLSIATSLGLSWWNPRSVANASVLLNRTLTQKLGLGYAFRRNVYVYPFLTFLPDRFDSSTMTFNLTTIFSIF